MSELQTLAGLNIIKPADCVFSRAAGGYVSLKYGEKDYERVKLCRAVPYRHPDEYVCVIDKDGNEIGILKNIRELSKENLDIVTEELQRLYYCPEISKILSVKDRMGYMYFEVTTSAGKREFALRDASRNIKYVNPDKKGAVQILDVDGNRYIINDFDAIDAASRKKIEAFLV